MGSFADAIRKNFNNKMEYPQDFIDKCLSVYPDNEEIKELLEDKSFLLGKFLKTNISLITKEELKKSTKEELDKRRKEIQAKQDLILDFEILYENQYLRNNKCIDERCGLVYNDPSHKFEHDCDSKSGDIKKIVLKVDPNKQLEKQEELRHQLDKNESERRQGYILAETTRCGDN